MALMYCRKCGRIVHGHYNDNCDDPYYCDCCQSITYRVPSKYLDESLPFMLKGKDDSETRQKLYEELVKTSPEFDQYLFDHRAEILAKKSAEYKSKMEVGKALLEGKKVSRQEILAGKLNSSSGSVSVTCPYCNSTNTEKITATSKAINTALFGIFGTKRHKQWHCNKCGSDF